MVWTSSGRVSINWGWQPDLADPAKAEVSKPEPSVPANTLTGLTKTGQGERIYVFEGMDEDEAVKAGSLTA